MSLKPEEDIGMEVPRRTTSFSVSRVGTCVINGNDYELRDDVAVVVPAGVQHHIIKTSKTEGLKFYMHIKRMGSFAPRRKRPRPKKRNSTE